MLLSIASIVRPRVRNHRGHFDAFAAGAALYPGLRGGAVPSSRLEAADAPLHSGGSGVVIRRNSAGPAPPVRRTGVSSGVLEQNGYGSLRHASSVDRFITWADPRP